MCDFIVVNFVNPSYVNCELIIDGKFYYMTLEIGKEKSEFEIFRLGYSKKFEYPQKKSNLGLDNLYDILDNYQNFLDLAAAYYDYSKKDKQLSDYMPIYDIAYIKMEYAKFRSVNVHKYLRQLYVELKDGNIDSFDKLVKFNETLHKNLMFLHYLASLFYGNYRDVSYRLN